MSRFSWNEQLSDGRNMKEKTKKELEKKLKKEKRKRRKDKRQSESKIQELELEMDDLTNKLDMQKGLEYVLKDKIKKLKAQLEAQNKAQLEALHQANHNAQLAAKPACNVCLEEFGAVPKRALILACGHSTCQECCANLFERPTTARPNGIRCPTCRKYSVVNDVTLLPVNYALDPINSSSCRF